MSIKSPSDRPSLNGSCSRAILAATLLFSQGLPAFCAGAYYETKSGGFDIVWSKQDLKASKDKLSVFQASTLARKERLPKSAKTTQDRAFKLLSVVGPVLSFQHELSLDWPGMVHPGVGDVRRYQAVDLRHPNTRALLSDYFGEQDIFAGLMTNSMVKKALKGHKPKNLKALIKELATLDVVTTDAEGNEARLLFNQDMLSQFAFTKLTQQGVEVAISLYDQANNDISPIVFNLPLKNAELTQWLKDAGAKKEGILQSKLKIADDAETDFHFEP